MFTVSQFTVEHIKDPFQIIEGDRYEFMLNIDVEEDDELYHEEGVVLRVVFGVKGDQYSIAKYEFLTSGTLKYIDMEMEQAEYEMIVQFCKENFKEQQ